MNFIKKNKGFFQYILILVIAICLLAYFNITAKGAIDWFINAVKKVF